MNIGIIGLPQSGKKTVFELLVGSGSLAHHNDPGRVARGVADVHDDRFDRLQTIYKPKKLTYARMDMMLPPRIEERSVSQGDIFRDLAEVEVFCHVVRAFEDDAVYHVSGSVDPVRDIEYVNTEFILHDLLFIEKRLGRLDKDLMKKKDEDGAREHELLTRLKTELEAERPLRVVEIAPEDESIIKSYPLLSRREMIVVLNVAESDVSDVQRVGDIHARFVDESISCVQVAAKTELEIAGLESAGERAEFMAEMGIQEVALPLLTRKCIGALGLISFFTAGPKELRQWFVRRGSHAVEAAGKIHTDLARGFIRAEVIHYDDLIELGSEEQVKAAGRFAVKGRDYIVEDGDLLFIRFNV